MNDKIKSRIKEEMSSFAAKVSLLTLTALLKML